MTDIIKIIIFFLTHSLMIILSLISSSKISRNSINVEKIVMSEIANFIAYIQIYLSVVLIFIIL